MPSKNVYVCFAVSYVRFKLFISPCCIRLLISFKASISSCLTSAHAYRHVYICLTGSCMPSRPSTLPAESSAYIFQRVRLLLLHPCSCLTKRSSPPALPLSMPSKPSLRLLHSSHPPRPFTRGYTRDLRAGAAPPRQRPSEDPDSQLTDTLAASSTACHC